MSAAARELFDQDHLHFQLLQRISANLDCVYTLQPSDIDKLGVEISKALQRASVPESNVSEKEKKVNETMLACMGSIDHRLSLKKDQSASDGAMLMLYRKTMISPDNLQALFRMVDSNIRTGKVRCHAIWHLGTFLNVQATWKVKLPLQEPGRNNSTSTSVAAKVITVMSAALSEQRDLCGNQEGSRCCCHERPWIFFGEALGVCRDEPEKVVDLLHPWDWATILQRPDAAVMGVPPERPLFYDSILLDALHRWCIRLLKENHNNTKAKEVLQKLGGCDTLLRRQLRRVISGETSCTPGSTMTFEEMAPVVNFLNSFLHCLSPVPWDREIDSLVRRARPVIAKSFKTVMKNKMEIAAMAQNPERSDAGKNAIHGVLFLMDHLKDLHRESEDARWQRFHNRYLVHEANPKDGKGLSKSLLKGYKKVVKSSTNLTQGEMCANCYVLEKTLHEKLLKCGQCRLIKYCSQECQKDHWKKAHKQQCQTF
jgi:hypothetical protein